jgi:uncharacterized iron-regulated protein
MRFSIVLLMLIAAVCYLWGDDMRIVNTKTGKDITLQNMAKELANYDIIFFGEFHDNTTIHNLQKDLLPLIDGKKELILSFEMFERDVQPVLDSYLTGKITETTFLENSRPWGNYDPDYKPLIEYAKSHNLKAVAANVPRRYAGKMARLGLDFLDELEPEEMAWIAKSITAPDDAYKKAFFTTMDTGSDTHGMMTAQTDLENMYRAQCLKDDTMAESIVMAIQANPKAMLIHYNGDFHSRSFLGTVSRVQSALPKLKIAVISPIYEADLQLFKPVKEDLDSGNYLILLPVPEKGGDE